METPSFVHLEARYPHNSNATHVGPLTPDQTVVITHPFHPRHGEHFTYFSSYTRNGLCHVRLSTVDLELIIVPIAWTSLRAVDAFEQYSQGRCAWRMDGLIQLCDLLDEIVEENAEL